MSDEKAIYHQSLVKDWLANFIKLNFSARDLLNRRFVRGLPDIILKYSDNKDQAVFAFMQAIIAVWFEDPVRTDRDEKFFQLLFGAVRSFRPCGNIVGIVNAHKHGGIWSKTVAEIIFYFAKNILQLDIKEPQMFVGKEYGHMSGSGMTVVHTTAHRWYAFENMPKRWLNNTVCILFNQQEMEAMIRRIRMSNGHV